MLNLIADYIHSFYSCTMNGAFNSSHWKLQVNKCLQIEFLISIHLGAWRLMFMHNINDNIFEPFVDENDVLYKNTGNTSALLYSRLGKIFLFYKILLKYSYLLGDMEEMRFPYGMFKKIFSNIHTKNIKCLGYFQIKFCFWRISISEQGAGVWITRHKYILKKISSEPCNQWTQTSDFTKESNITGFKPIKLIFPEGYFWKTHAIEKLRPHSDLLDLLLG